MTYAIRRISKEHLGFILTSGGPNSGNCIFRSLPVNSNDFDAPDSVLLYDLQVRGEFRWLREGDTVLVKDDHGLVIARISEGNLSIGDFTFETVALDR